MTRRAKTRVRWERVWAFEPIADIWIPVFMKTAIERAVEADLEEQDREGRKRGDKAAK